MQISPFAHEREDTTENIASAVRFVGLFISDLEYIRRECVFAYEIYTHRPDWPQVDLTAKPVEEVAFEIVSQIGHPEEESDDQF